MPNGGDVAHVEEPRFLKAVEKLHDERIKEIVRHAIAHPRDPQYQPKAISGKRVRDGSTRIKVTNQRYRAIAQVSASGTWHWWFFGTHEEYNNLF